MSPARYVIDFESYYDDEVTVRRLGNFNYLAATNAYLVSVVGPDIHWVGNPLEFDFSRLAKGEIWAHNASFDLAYFLSRELPLPSPLYNCSSNLAGYLGSPRSLDGAAKHLLGIEVVKDVRKKMKGRTWHSLSSSEQEAVRAYALKDSEVAYELVQRYADQWPADEAELSRHTLEMGWRGVRIDTEKLAQYTVRAQEICEQALPEIPWRSNDPSEPDYPLSLPKAKTYCQTIGIDPPESFSEKSEACQQWETIYGARYPFVAATRRYRKSLYLLRRLEAMARRVMSNDGRMNYSLRYAGAHTLRWAGDAGLNLQNLRKKDFHGIHIRALIIPAPGKKLIIVDLASIEPRCLAYLCGDERLLEQLRRGANYYEAQARNWNVWDGPEGTFKEGCPDLRAIVKRQCLGCGYGVGPKRFRAAALEEGHVLDLLEAKRQVHFYRTHNPRVVALWNKLDYKLNMSMGAGEFRMELPSGRWLEYRNLRRVNGKIHCQLATEDGYRDSVLWGGSLTENATQAFARDIFAEKLLRLSRAGLRVVLHSHDEYLIEADKDVRLEDVQRLIDEPLEWAPGLPIASEGWEGDCYVH